MNTRQFIWVAGIVMASMAMYVAATTLNAPTDGVHVHHEAVDHGAIKIEASPARVVWACISAIIVCLVADVHGFAKALLTGANSVWQWNGIFVHVPSCAVLYIPRFTRRKMYLVLGDNTYLLKIEG